MIAFYTTGAGLGHLTRTLKVIKTLDLNSPIIIFSNSQFIQSSPPFLQLKVYCEAHQVEFISILPEVNYEDYCVRFIEQLKEKNVSELYIDCFPVGIYGELNGLSEQAPKIKLNLIARLIHWPNYQTLITRDNRFSSVFYVEALAESEWQYCLRVCEQIRPLTLVSFLDNALIREAAIVDIKKPYCLFVHSGSETEMTQLLDYGMQKLRFNKLNYTLVLASPWPIPAQFKGLNIRVIQCYPIIHWLMDASIIVSAAGFNLMNEVSLLKATHWVLPFERRYDDQFTRLAAHKQAKRVQDY